MMAVDSVLAAASDSTNQITASAIRTHTQRDAERQSISGLLKRRNMPDRLTSASTLDGFYRVERKTVSVRGPATNVVSAGSAHHMTLTVWLPWPTGPNVNCIECAS